MQHVFTFLSGVDSFLWGYVAFGLIALIGSYLTLRARFFHIRTLPSTVATFFQLARQSSSGARGVHPLRAFFASVGGMIGVGNVVGIVTAVQIGGPGALFWVWVAAFIGATIKYSEIFLGLKHRVANDCGGYDGGPMYFLRSAYRNRWIPCFVAVLLCIYGVEIYQFSVVTDSLSANFDLNRYGVIAILIALVLYASTGGVARIGRVCSLVMPVFLVVYLLMSLWVVFQERSSLAAIIQMVLSSAFTGHAAVGGFAGSSALLAIQQGLSRAAYSADIGIGYDSIIQSESNVVHPERQARLAILGVCIDNVICTLSILVVLLAGTWNSVDPIEGSKLVQVSLSRYFPYMNIFMPIFLFALGYTTIIAYFCVGIKCARFLSSKHGPRFYVLYGAIALFVFSFVDQTQALLMMSLAGAGLLITNLLGIFALRHHVEFSLEATTV